MTKEELNERLLFFQPEITFASTPGGLKLIMEVDAYNNHIQWEVAQGDHYSDVMNFDEAAEEYLAMGGDKYD